MAIKFLNNVAVDSDVLYVDTVNDRVGIGTTNPGAKLHVNKGIVGEVTRFGSGNYQLTFGVSTTYGEIQAVEQGVAYRNLLLNRAGGNVGIATTNPSEKLEVSGSIKSGNIKIQPANGGRIGLNRNTATGAIYNNSYGAFQIQNNGTGFFEIQSYNSSGTSTGVLSMLESNGNVGIGTTNSQGRLQIEGGTYVDNILGPNDLIIKSSSNVGGGIRLTNNTNKNWFVYHGGASSWVGDGGLGFVYSDGTTAATSPKITFLPSGNVGIGTTSPAVKLSVSGTIYASGGSAWNGGGTEGDATDAALIINEGNYIYTRDDNTYLRRLIGKGTDDYISLGAPGTSLIDGIKFYSGITGGQFRWFNNTSEIMRLNNNGLGIGTTDPASNAKLTVMGNQTFGLPGNGNNTDGRFISIEGNTDSSGEGSGRIFFTEHNSTTASMDNYGMSIGYRGGATTITGASGNSWTGLSQIGNGQWGMWGHNNDATGSIIMRGDRAATYVDFVGNNITDVGNMYVANAIYHQGDTDTYILFNDNTQRFFAAGEEMIKFNSSIVTINEAGGNNDLRVKGNTDDNLIYSDGSADKVGIGTASPSEKLEVNGNIKHTGLTMTEGTDVDQVKTFTMTYQLAADTWTDTGINAGDLSTGTYIMQVYADDHSAGGQHYDEYYSATISWFGTGTNSTAVDEIVVHRAGHAPNANDLQFRTQRHSGGGDDLMLQVKANLAHTAAMNNTDGRRHTYKFRRLI